MINDRRPEGVTWGSCPAPWNLKMIASYAVSVQSTLNIFGSPKNLSFLSVHAVLLPSGKMPAGTHGSYVKLH